MFVLFNIEIEHGMRTMIPLVFCIDTRTDIFTYVPSHIHKGELLFIPLLIMNTRFIQQQQQVPIAAFMVVTTSTGAIEIEGTAFWQYLLCHLLDVVDNL